MAKTTNPIEDRYWHRILADAMLAKKLEKSNIATKINIVVLALVLLVFFSIPMIPMFDGERLATICQYLTFEGYNLDEDIRLVFTPVEYFDQVLFFYKWLGFASAACLLYWVLFMNPFEKLRQGSVTEYTQDTVFENPKSVLVFLKHSFKDQKYRWLGFFYTWCVGFLICSLWDSPQWTWIFQHQYYWLNKIPSLVPLALIMLLAVNVVFAILIGMARPATRASSRKKTIALVAIGACLVATVLLALLNADAVRDYVENWDALYSIRYPEDPLDPADEYFINFNALFWTLGMVFSALLAMFFPIICTLYQNAKFRSIVKQKYYTVTGDEPWEHVTLKRKHDEQEKRKRLIKGFSAFELAFFFGLVILMLWGFYFYWGERAGNDTMKNIAIGVMGFELVWALFISPFLHYRLEKDLLYQGKGVAWVATEDRGIGSWRKYWRLLGRFESKGFEGADLERKKSLDITKHVTVFLVFAALYILGTTVLAGELADAFGNDIAPTQTAFAVVYLLFGLFYMWEFSRMNKNIKTGKPGFESKGKAKVRPMLVLLIVAIPVSIIAIAVLSIDAIEVAFDDTDALISAAIWPLGIAFVLLILYYSLIWPACMRLSVKKGDRKFWKCWRVKNEARFSHEEKKKVASTRRFVTVLSGIMALWICGNGMWETSTVSDIFESIFNAIGLSSDLPSNEIIKGTFALGHVIIMPLLFLYCLKILKFNDVKDPDRGKKRVYSIIFLIFLAGMTVGIVDVFNKLGADIVFLFQEYSTARLLTGVFAVSIGGLLVLGLVLACFPVFARLDDLFDSIKDMIMLFLVGVIFLTLWNYLCEWFLTTPSLHWSWTDDVPENLRDSFSILPFFTRVSGYFYWGWVQELLFLGYFCWLLYKIEPKNQWLNATISSLLFMMFHWDNIALMVGTAIGGFAWAIFWKSRRNLFMLGWMHGFNGTLVDMLVPMSMTVGPGAH